MYFKHIPKIFRISFPDPVWTVKNSDFYYLTFDDGPHPESTPLLLDKLEQLNVKVYFFCLGSQVENYPELYKRIKTSGHGIGHHGYNHLSGWKTETRTYTENLKTSNKVFKSNLYRPPYGRISYDQYKIIKKDFKIVMWDIMPGDFDNKVSAESAAKFIEKNARYGSIVALHDNPRFIYKTLKILDLLDKDFLKKCTVLDL